MDLQDFNKIEEPDFAGIYASVFGSSAPAEEIFTAAAEQTGNPPDEDANADDVPIASDLPSSEPPAAAQPEKRIPPVRKNRKKPVPHERPVSESPADPKPGIVSAPPGAEEIEFDSRFNIDRNAEGKPRKDYSYNGYRVSTTQDLNYRPKEAPEYSELRSSYTGYDDYEQFFGEDGPKADPIQKKKKKLALPNLKPGKKKTDAVAEHDISEFVNTEHYSDPENESVPPKKKKFRKPEIRVKKFLHPEDHPEEVLPDEDFPIPPVDREPESLFASLEKYILSRLAGLMLLVRGNISAEESSATMSTDEEVLGPELKPLAASKYYGSQVYSLRLRTRITAALLLLMCYLSLGFPVPGMLQNLRVSAAAVLALQFTIMILALDTVTNAITNAFRLKFGADFLAVFSCILTALDGAAVLNSPNVYTHMPLCAVSSFSLLGILFSSLLSARGMRKSLRVLAIGKNVYTVTAEANVTEKEKTILKSTRPISGFVRRMEEAPIDETIFRKAGPVLLILALLFSIVVAIVKRSFVNILYIFSAIYAPAVPFTALLCFSLPFFIGSLRIFSSGAALAGWSGVYDIGHSKNLIVTDRDVFPPECIEIENVRIFADYDSQKVLSYAGSLILASESALAPSFSRLLAENECGTMRVDHLEFLSGGGLKGMVEGHVIIVGNCDLMHLLNVRIPYRLVTSTSVLLSIDGILYGIFNIKYTADPKIRRALVSLMRSNRHPIFALRDFNITPDMIHECFDVATDGYDFPPYAERFPISEAKPAEDSQISAVVCKEGLGSVTDVADTGRSVYVVSRMNVVISLASAVLGLFISFLKLMILGYSTIGGILLVMFLFSLPVILLGCFTTAVN